MEGKSEVLKNRRFQNPFLNVDHILCNQFVSMSKFYVPDRFFSSSFFLQLVTIF